MQLQVANGDDYLVGNLARGKTFDDRTDRKGMEAECPRQCGDARGAKIEKPAHAPSQHRTHFGGDPQPVISVPRRLFGRPILVLSFETMLPLTVFMDENPRGRLRSCFLCGAISMSVLADQSTANDVANEALELSRTAGITESRYFDVRHARKL
jgi:hypothetical protein